MTEATEELEANHRHTDTNYRLTHCELELATDIMTNRQTDRQTDHPHSQPASNNDSTSSSAAVK